MDLVNLPYYQGEWIEWRDDELDEVPVEQWALECTGLQELAAPSPSELQVKVEYLLGPETLPKDISARLEVTRPYVERLQEEWSKKHGRGYSRKHKPFVMGRISQNRDGEITIAPRSAKSMTIDAERRTVTFNCGYRLDADHSKRCTFTQTLDLDKVLVVLTQTYTRGQRFDPRNPDDFRPCRFPKRIIGVWDTFTLEPSLDAEQHPEAWADLQQAVQIYIEEYQRRRTPEKIVNRQGDVIMTLM